jgi:YD repeat-containing protein
MRHALLIGMTMIALVFASVIISYAETVNYIYDELNRLIRVEYADGTKIEYTYDGVGNRSQVYVGKYTLAVNVVGGGTVTKNPDQPIYSAGTSVTLTAVNGSQTFSGWSGDLTGNTNPTTIVMDGNKSVTATFVTPEGWLQGWTYRKAVTLSRASGAVTNYQMKLLVGESSGASGENVDCNGHCRTDFNDLRFTTSDGQTLLDYWIETITGTTPNQLATVWIKFDSIGTGDTIFYMYYGKVDAPAVSSGANTFIVFDDFERGNDGDNVGGNWTIVQGAVKISTAQAFRGTRSGKWIGGSPTPMASIPVTYSNNIAMRMRIFKPDASQADIYFNCDGTHRIWVREQTNEDVRYYVGGSGMVDTTYNCGISNWDVLEVSNLRAGESPLMDIWLNGSKIKDDASWHYNGSAYQNKTLIAGHSAGNDLWIDNYIVRNFRDVEPAWGAWGAEQAN